MLYNQEEIEKRILVIKMSTKEDKEILSSNYKILLKNASNYEERTQYIRLLEIIKNK